jgi:hypothetical protein
MTMKNTYLSNDLVVCPWCGQIIQSPSSYPWNNGQLELPKYAKLTMCDDCARQQADEYEITHEQYYGD